MPAAVAGPRTDLQQLADDDRRQPERQLVDHQQAGLGDSRAIVSVSICCSPPRQVGGRLVASRLRQHGEVLERLVQHRGARWSRSRLEPAGQAQVLGDGERREHALAAGHLDDAAPGDLVRAERR